MLTNITPSNSAKRERRTFLLEADLDGDEVLKEDIVNVGVVQVEELFQLCRLSILCKIKETVEDCSKTVHPEHLENICVVLCR